MRPRTMPAIVLLAIVSLLLAATAAVGSTRGVLHAMSVSQRPVSAEVKLISKCKAPTCFARHGRYLEARSRVARRNVHSALASKESHCARVAASLYLHAAADYRLAGHAFRYRHYTTGGKLLTAANRELTAAAKRARRCI